MNLEGSRLWKYELDEEIGRGTLGVVYQGYEPSVNRRVAVKVLHLELAQDSTFPQVFLRTVRLASKIDHPHFVTIYDAGWDGDWYYFVMEFLDGQPLDEYLRQRAPLPPDRVLSLLRQMADALDYFHAQGLIHGNVKPSNVIVDADGHVKLTDLGFMRPSVVTKTVHGASTGASPYASPEQVRGQPIGPSADVYSLAALAFELLAGISPNDAASTPAGLDGQAQAAPSIVALHPDLPPALDAVFGRALDQQPDRRYWSGTTFVTALAEALEEQSSPAVAGSPLVVQSQPEPAVPSPWALSRRWFAGAALIAFLLVLGMLTVSGKIGIREPSSTPALAAANTQTPSVTQTVHLFTPEVATHTPLPEPTDALDLPQPTTPSDRSGSIVTVQVPVADVHVQPERESDLVTQVIMGEKVMILAQEGVWYQIAAVDQPSPEHVQGYPGWLQKDQVSLQPIEPTETAIVIVPSAPVRISAAEGAAVLYELSIDSRLPVKSADDAWVIVSLPGGYDGWLARHHVRLVCPEGSCRAGIAWEPDTPRPVEEVVETAMQFIGTPYQWGGTSSSAFDCSGFVYRVFHANGITLPRDSHPMSQSGTWVEKDELRPGDVVFLANSGPTGQVSHCSLYIGDGKMVTSVGTSPISIVPLDHDRYLQEYWGARRYP